MRSWITILTCAGALTLACSTAGAATYRVFLLAGQSNMDGRASTDDLPTSPVNLQQPQDEVLFYHGNAGGYSLLPADTWIPLQPGSGSKVPLSQFGPEITFGRGMADAFPNENIALIKYSRGGSRLASHWAPGGEMYSEFTSTVQDALHGLTEAGDTFDLAGMIWHQGESDAIASLAENYETNLIDFVDRVRTDLFDGEYKPFLIGQLSSNQTALDASLLATVRLAQQNVAASVPNTGLVVTDDLSLQDDYLHFDAAGQQGLGSRFAVTMSSMWTPDPPSNPPIPTIPEPGTLLLALAGLATFLGLRCRRAG